MRVARSNAMLALIFVALLAGPRLGYAQERTDEELIAAGVAARRDGNDDAALALFTQAWEQGHTPRARAQIGLAEQALGRFADADTHLVEALASAEDEWIIAQRAALEEALVGVRARLRGEDAPIDTNDPAARALLEARAQSTAGQAAFDSGAWAPALAAFERAHALTDDPEFVYDIALTLERLGRNAEAVAQYEAYVLAVPDAPRRATVDARLSELRTRLAIQRSTDERAARQARERDGARHHAMLARRSREGGLLGKWWFWAAVGAVATAATVSTVLVLSDDAPAAIPGSSGHVLTALTVAP